MLVLTRKEGQSICLGDGIVVKVAAIKGNSVRLAIEAPRHVAIHRAEVWERIQQELMAGATTASSCVVESASR